MTHKESFRIQNTHGAMEASGLAQRQWSGPADSIAVDGESGTRVLRALHTPCYVVRQGDQIGITNAGSVTGAGNGTAPEADLLAMVPPISLTQLGNPDFCRDHGVKYAYATGAMANGIASEELVIAMGKAGLLASFGAAGLPPHRLEAAIERIQSELPDGPYAFNLIHSPSEDALERNAVDLYLKHDVTTVEASAFLDLTPHVVRYRAVGLSRNAQGEIVIGNKIIAKLSRREVAEKFMNPAPERILSQLQESGQITAEQAELAAQVPVADDVTVEADSGGHTDNRPLVGLLPSILALRDQIQAERQYDTPIRVGAAGGISTPSSTLGAFMMGADYVVSGSINQACVESGASTHTKKLLAQADMADVTMAPAADMFEMGVKVQVLKRGTLFAMRAQKLYDVYQQYESIEAIPAKERERLEKQTFRRSLDSVWDDTVAFFGERDPEQIERANNNPKRKMALIFRWYLGLSSRWSNVGEAGREVDYQIWCGPSMGAFNSWTQGSYLEEPENRHVAEVAHQIMNGAAYLYRLQMLKMQGVSVPSACLSYRPEPVDETASDEIAPAVPETPAPAQSVPPAQAVVSAAPPLAEHNAAPQAAPEESGKSAEAIQTWLVNNLAERIEVDPDDIDIREPFESYNLDSAQVLILASELEEWLGAELSPTLLWNYPTIEKLSQRLATMQSAAQVSA